MSTEASLMLKLKKKSRVLVSISRNSVTSRRRGENSFDNDRVYDRENGLKKRVNFQGRESGEEGRALRTRKGENSLNKNKVYGRENGFKKRVNFNGRESSEKGRGAESGEKRGMFGTSGSDGRKKWIYGKEERVENGKIWNGVGGSNNKPLLTKGEEQQLKQLVEGKTDDHRTMWGPGKKGNVGIKTKHLTPKIKDKKEGSSFITKNDQDKTWLKNKVKDKAGLYDNAETVADQPKKKKKTVRIEYPNDISKKRADEDLGIKGIKEDKKTEPEEEPVMSKNAQFRAIQPSPSILSFVENNMLGKRRMIELRRAGYNIELSAPLDNIPFSKSSERERIEENAFRNKMEFFAAANVSSSFPPPNLPEIAFAGRSNVGKSSLLNALTRQWGIARTSDKPGLTKTINFFKLGTKLSLVDLPGYGFAYAKDEVKENWEELVKEYVSTRVGLKRVCLLVDTKWGMKPRDHELIELMERSKTNYQIVLTKTDVVFPIDVARRAMQIEERLLGNQSIVQPLMMVSSKSGAGIRSLRTVLANIARFAKI